MTFSFHPEAESEFREAIDYYEDCERGLGYDFSLEVLSTIQNIVNYPITLVPIISSSHFPIISEARAATYYIDATNGSDPSLLTIFHNL
jgi:hypothetical protein